MKRLTVLGTLAALLISIVGFATEAEAQYYGRVRTSPLYGATPLYNGGQLSGGPHYDVWGRLVGSDPNNPIFRDSATAAMPWNTPNNFNPYAPDPYAYYPPTYNPYAGYYGNAYPNRSGVLNNVLRGLGF
jgi:hypothetical protein